MMETNCAPHAMTNPRKQLRICKERGCREPQAKFITPELFLVIGNDASLKSRDGVCESTFRGRRADLERPSRGPVSLEAKIMKCRRAKLDNVRHKTGEVTSGQRADGNASSTKCSLSLSLSRYYAADKRYSHATSIPRLFWRQGCARAGRNCVPCTSARLQAARSTQSPCLLNVRCTIQAFEVGHIAFQVLESRRS